MNLIYDADHLARVCDKYQVDYLGVFGSAARGENQDGSDIDLLAKFNPSHNGGLFEMARMRDELESVFGKKIDLLTEGFLSKYFKDEVMTELKQLYAKT